MQKPYLLSIKTVVKHQVQIITNTLKLSDLIWDPNIMSFPQVENKLSIGIEINTTKQFYWMSKMIYIFQTSPDLFKLFFKF